MTPLEALQVAAAVEIDRTMRPRAPDNASAQNYDQALEAVHAIAQYTLALALDRLAKAGCDASAQRLAQAILYPQQENLRATTTPTPKD